MQRMKCLTQGHNAVAPVRLELQTPRKFSKGPIKNSNGPLKFGNLHVCEWERGHLGDNNCIQNLHLGRYIVRYNMRSEI